MTKTAVLDTNCFGKRFSPRVLEDVIATAAANGSSVWVPDVVIWELAEHEHSAYQASLPAYRREAERAVRIGIEAEAPTEQTVEDFVTAMEKQFAQHPEIEILRLDGEEAVAAIRDQVLQTGSGSRKQETKTGAADSGWLRTVAKRNGGDLKDLILVTGDRAAVEGLCAKEGWEPPQIAANFNAARLAAGWSKGASIPQIEALTAWLEQLLPLMPSAATDGTYDRSEINFDHFDLWELDVVDDADWNEIYSVDTLESLTAVSVTDDGHQIRASGEFNGHVAYLMIDEDREGDMFPRLVDSDDSILYADITVQLDSAGNATSISFG
ncbi:hypothetical protein [Homoserinibacter sp. YIM 151385]|uniref:hypothetical protein n=1 Tax=Homoserinibacter sp. YIM 151385 TaxID=2985506 RepID=UPI0022F04EEE|nr:hypothetical protein [Homoserinibacter sp. YIM 151385]WBU36704.1 hypothetical protein OF852_07070 [Homoserinibacter sp. YIM 151385]